MHEVFTPGLRRIAQILMSPGAGVPGAGSTDQVRAIVAVNLVMMASRPILPDIGQEATPEMVSEAVLELALGLVARPV